MEKPADVLFNVDEKPPVFLSFTMAVQHILIMASSLVYPLVIVNSIDADQTTAHSLLSFSMIAAGISCMILSMKNKLLGSGYLTMQSGSAAYIYPSVLAAKAGGLPLIMGMTIFAGAFPGVLAYIVKKSRQFFPPEVSGLVIAMVGVSLVPIAADNFMGLSANDQFTETEEVIVSAATLITIIALNVWARGYFKVFALAAGIAIGYGLSFYLDVVSPELQKQFIDADFIYIPDISHIGYSFDPYYTIPFIIAAISMTIKTSGDIIALQKISDAEWIRPDMNSVSKGLLSSALGTVIAGLGGGVGQATMSSNIGFAAASGILSRVIAFFVGGLFIAMAFFPKLISGIALMPAPVIGAVLILLASYIIMTGIQILLSRMIDARKTFIIGISIIFGISVDTSPHLYENVHPLIRPVFESSLYLSTIVAVLLNGIFRIGIYRKVFFDVKIGKTDSHDVWAFMERQGGIWGARKEVIYQASSAINEFLAWATLSQFKAENLNMAFAFDEFHLFIDITYRGPAPDIPARAPTPDELLDDPDGVLKLAAHMLKQNVDRIRIFEKEKQTRVRFEFVH